MNVYRWNGGVWHVVIAYDLSFKDLSANVLCKCGWRGASGKPDVAKLADNPHPLCKKCMGLGSGKTVSFSG